MPPRIFINVDLPAPFSPTSADDLSSAPRRSPRDRGRRRREIAWTTADIFRKGSVVNGELRRSGLGTAVASAPRGVGGRCRPSSGSSVAGRTGRRCPARGRQHTSRPAISVHGNSRVSGARNPDYQSVFVFDNDHPCVGPDAPRQLEPRRRASIGTAPATGMARVVCYTPEAQHHAGRTAGR